MASRLLSRIHSGPGIWAWNSLAKSSRRTSAGTCCRAGSKRFESTASARKAGTGNKSTSEWPHTIYASSRITDRKSVFLAHASTLPNSTSFPLFLAHLTALPALKRATHCMYAYRTSDSVTSQPILGQNDGGESGSGDKLARLLELARCENTVVVVSRWYGGVHLGSDRWRLISSVANAALDQGGFKRPKQQPNGTKKKSSSRKRK